MAPVGACAHKVSVHPGGRVRTRGRVGCTVCLWCVGRGCAWGESLECSRGTCMGMRVKTACALWLCLSACAVLIVGSMSVSAYGAKGGPVFTSGGSRVPVCGRSGQARVWMQVGAGRGGGGVTGPTGASCSSEHQAVLKIQNSSRTRNSSMLRNRDK